MIKPFLLSEVELTDPYLSNAFHKEKEYLLSFDNDKLVSHFRATKGLEPKASCYQGWEDTEIRGHTLGHYLSALAQAYAATKDSILGNKLQYILEELALCQFDNGYLSAFPEEFFDRVEEGKPVWVPWYTMHKIIAGVVETYLLTQWEVALRIATRLGDWVYDRTNRWSDELQAKVLSVEYGGMNDCMYELYKITGDEKHSIAAHKFDELPLFNEIYNGNDILNNRHANTTIPKFLGALNRCFAHGEGEEFYLEACKKFWDMVIHNHSYVTGGNSEWEHFGEPHILDAERTEANCETCNTYNMLKLSRGLFQITGDKKYSDFYENTFINAILSSQNPETGMTMYFQPMATGYFKVYSEPFKHFWCCTGTGMENFTKLNDSIYFYEEDKLYTNMYFSSILNWKEKKLSITQTADLPNSNTMSFTIHTQSDEIILSLYFRIPEWSKNTGIRVNGMPVTYERHKEYAVLEGQWKDNDRIDISFSIEVSYSSLPDNKNVVAFTYGPVVLSAGLGAEEMEESTTGVAVQIPKKQQYMKDYIIVKGKSIELWKEEIGKHLMKQKGALEFKLAGTDEDDHLIFTPHYKQHTERYGIYWNLVEEGSKELQQYLLEKEHETKVKAAEIDAIQIGNDQYELSHHIVGQDTESGDRDGYHYRFAKQNGWFHYEMKVNPVGDTYLQFSYMPGDCRDSFFVYVNDVLLSTEVIGDKSWRDLTKKSYLIPREVYEGQTSVVVKFMAKETCRTGRIVEIIRTSSME